MGILDYLQRILNQIGNLINSDFQILSTLITSGWSAAIFEGAKVTVDVHSLLTDPDCGQVAQCDKLTTILGDLATLSMDLAALGAPQQAGSPVTLPAVPPAGYGGATASAAAAAVWAFIPGGFGQTMGFFQENAGLFAVNLSATSLRVGLADQARWTVYGSWVNTNGPDLPDRDVPSLDPATILPTDTDIAAWINRVQPGYLAYLTPEHWATIDGSNSFNYLYDMSPWEFATIRANNAPKSWGALGSPVWPGLADVTFDVPTAFADVPFTVVGPMDGVLISITSVPQPNAQYDFNGTVSYRYLGSITFEDDNGDCEFAQSLGFQSAIYVPAHMNHASFCRIRPNKSGIVGTVTPWTKN